MKGATAENWAKASSTLSNTSVPIRGTSQYFLRSRAKPHRSLSKSNIRTDAPCLWPDASATSPDSWRLPDRNDAPSDHARKAASRFPAERLAIHRLQSKLCAYSAIPRPRPAASKPHTDSSAWTVGAKQESTGPRPDTTAKYVRDVADAASATGQRTRRRARRARARTCVARRDPYAQSPNPLIHRELTPPGVIAWP